MVEKQMKSRLIALLLVLSLAAGCSAAPSQSDTSVPQEAYTPSYTYVNPDPDMVMVTSPGGDITYENYRLYLDVSEQMNRMTARQNMAVCAALEKDFAGMGIEVKEEDFQAMASQQLLNAMLYTPSFTESLQQIGDATGMAQEQVTDAMMLSFRSQYLVQLLGDHYQTLAAEELDKEAAASETASSETASSEAASSEPDGEAAQAAREQAVYEGAMEMMQNYSADYETRLTFEDDSALVTIDGEAVPYTEEVGRYIDYAGMANRIDAVAFIQVGELALRELERRGAELDRTDFEATLEDYISHIRSDEQAMQQIEKACGGFGATPDDYFKALERPLWLQEVGDRYYIAMTEEYNALTVDSGEKADSADSYYVQELSKLVEGSDIVNVTGK